MAASTEQITLTQEELDAKLEAAKKGTIDALTVEREKNREMKAQLDKLTTDANALKEAADKAAADKAAAELAGEGKYKEALAAMEASYEAERVKLADANKALKSQLTAYRVDNEIMSAAGNAVNAKQVVALMKSEFVITEKDDGTIEITTIDKKPVFDEAGKALDIKGITAKYLAENPHLVKPNGAAGAGTMGGAGNTGETATLDQQIAAAQKAGDRAKVIGLKRQKMSLGGPHNLKTEI